jgi:hypothetical protein
MTEVLAVVGAVVGGFVTLVGIPLLLALLPEQAPRLARGVLNFAAGWLPPGQRARWADEWSADVHFVLLDRGPLSALTLAVWIAITAPLTALTIRPLHLVLTYWADKALLFLFWVHPWLVLLLVFGQLLPDQLGWPPTLVPEGVIGGYPAGTDLVGILVAILITSFTNIAKQLRWILRLGSRAFTDARILGYRVLQGLAAGLYVAAMLVGIYYAFGMTVIDGGEISATLTVAIGVYTLASSFFGHYGRDYWLAGGDGTYFAYGVTDGTGSTDIVHINYVTYDQVLVGVLAGTTTTTLSGWPAEARRRPLAWLLAQAVWRCVSQGLKVVWCREGELTTRVFASAIYAFGSCVRCDATPERRCWMHCIPGRGRHPVRSFQLPSSGSVLQLGVMQCV